MYQKEYENIITLICNKHTPEKLVSHVLTETGLVKTLVSSSADFYFEFESGNKIESGSFATLCEITSILNDSENAAVKPELEKEEKWNNFFILYVDPIKQRFKEGLLSPPMNSGLGLNDYNNFNNYESTFESSTRSEKDSPIMTKLPMIKLLIQLKEDFKNGKRTEVIKNELEHNTHNRNSNNNNNNLNSNNSKKDDMELIHDDDDDYHYTNNEVNLANNLLKNYESEKVQKENHEFYDNSYWAPSVIVDEIDLENLVNN